jgi:hypothetical protein
MPAETGIIHATGVLRQLAFGLESEWVLGVHAGHELFMSIEVGQLIHESEPVIDDRFARIARWRTDKPAREADRLAQVQALLPEARRGPA